MRLILIFFISNSLQASHFQDLGIKKTYIEYAENKFCHELKNHYDALAPGEILLIECPLFCKANPYGYPPEKILSVIQEIGFILLNQKVTRVLLPDYKLTKIAELLLEKPIE